MTRTESGRGQPSAEDSDGGEFTSATLSEAISNRQTRSAATNDDIVIHGFDVVGPRNDVR